MYAGIVHEMLVMEKEGEQSLWTTWRCADGVSFSGGVLLRHHVDGNACGGANL